MYFNIDLIPLHYSYFGKIKR